MFLNTFSRTSRCCYFTIRRAIVNSSKCGYVLKVILILTIVMIASNIGMKNVLNSVKSRTTTEFDANNNGLMTCEERPVISDKSVPVSTKIHSFEELSILHGNGLSTGGNFRPLWCKPDQKVAIVIPYRDREGQMKILLNNLHPFLKKQNIDYTIFVVEQLPGSKFNRGMIKNIGFAEAQKISDFDCFFFHDVDMIPDDNGNVYRCGGQPRQHSRDLERWKHKVPYSGSFGGVVSIKTAQFLKVNGYSNTYFEWGLEDDEMGSRIKFKQMKIISYPFKVSSYLEFNHKKSGHYKRSWKWFKSWKTRMDTDGLNSLVYTVKHVSFKPLFIHILVHIDVSAVKEAYKGQIMIAQEGEEPFE